MNILQGVFTSSKTSIQNSTKIISLLCIIILFSGCIQGCTDPKEPLEEVILRVAQNEDEKVLFDFIESYDYLSFLGLNQSDKRILSRYENSPTNGKFAQNYSLLLEKAKDHYTSEKDMLSGNLFYYITCKNITWSNQSNIDEIIIDLTSYENFSYSDEFTFGGFGIAAYRLSNSTDVVIREDDYSISQVFPQTIDSEWFWIILVTLNYEWTCCSYGMGAGCYMGHRHTELILYLSQSSVTEHFCFL
ncbi:MAG: hypothetical protein ACXACU_10075 [Candidatus Hodarchaeales archaeon]|jgi:hypothetical protein